MSKPSIIHPDCQGHVSLSFGVVYCTKTSSLYVNAAMVRTGKPRLGSLEPADCDVLARCMSDFMGTYSRVLVRSVILIDPWTELPGMRVNGLDPDEPGAFYQKGVGQ